MKSIQSKLLLVVISELLVITIVVSAIAVNITHGIMHKDADRILSNVCQKEAAYINDVLGDIEQSAKVMEYYATEEVWDLDDLRDEEYRASYVKKVRNMFIDVALNTKGLEGFFLRINPEYSDGTTGFYTIITGSGGLKDMRLTDITKFEAEDKRNVGWYYIAVNSGRAVWMEPYYFPGHEELLISYVLPMYVDGELLGILGFDMNFQYLVERINSIDVYERGHAVLIAGDEVTCYNAPQEAETHNPHTKAVSKLKNGMYLELRADYKDIQNEIHSMLFVLIIAFSVTLLLSIVYTIIVTRRIVRPLEQLTYVAEHMSDGISEEVIEKIPVNAKDEVGTLSRVLLKAYVKIQDYTAYVNALAYCDSLTGLKNTTAYKEAVSELDSRINSGSPKFGVLVADINNLKKTNDQFGHDAGNELIIHAAKILTDTFTDSPIFRIGGDEFVIILKDSDYDNYNDRMRQMDEAGFADFITVFENKIPVSMARGAALFEPGADKAYKEVFAKADHMMYLHKEKCKNDTNTE